MRYYTTQQRSDGFGAVFQNIIYDILYTEHTGNTYVFTGIQKIDHNYADDQNFTDNLNLFMNLEDTFPTPVNCDIDIYSSRQESYDAIESNITQYLNSPTMVKIKHAFLKNKTPSYDPQRFHIAVHIRRPNPCDDRLEGSTTPLEWYFLRMCDIQYKYHDKECIFHIYSQGKEEDFQLLSELPVQFHLNESVQDTFLGFVFADILITSQSSFSYCAALLRDKPVYYMKFWHPPHSDWVVCP